MLNTVIIVSPSTNSWLCCVSVGKPKKGVIYPSTLDYVPSRPTYVKTSKKRVIFTLASCTIYVNLNFDALHVDFSLSGLTDVQCFTITGQCDNDPLSSDSVVYYFKKLSTHVG